MTGTATQRHCVSCVKTALWHRFRQQIVPCMKLELKARGGAQRDRKRHDLALLVLLAFAEMTSITSEHCKQAMGGYFCGMHMQGP